jgi:hypothetical protein
MTKTVILYLAAFLCGFSSIHAKSSEVPKDLPAPKVLSESCFKSYKDTTSDFWITVSNRVALGNPFDGWQIFSDEIAWPETVPYSFNASYPADRSTEYLHGAGLWIGGVKAGDTLVSHAFDYIVPIPELMPVSCQNTDMKPITNRLADREIQGMATDTILATDTSYRCIVGDCDDWRPLGVEVVYNTYRWDSPPYQNILWVLYSVTNIDTTALDEGWVGIYADCDIGTGIDAHTDDISGFVTGAVNDQSEWVELHAGYSLDTDGDPENFNFTDASHTGAFVVQFLGMDRDGIVINANWWADAEDETFGAAPRQLSDYRLDLGGSFSEARGDSNKYHVMSNIEHDYNQIEAGYPHVGWWPQGDPGAQIAFGADTRFLLSAGPFTLQPHETIEFAVAYYIVDSIVTNPFVSSWLNTQDPQLVADYYETLDFTDFNRMAIIAQEVYESSWTLPPPGPPSELIIAGHTDTSVTLEWAPKEGLDVAGYKIYYSHDVTNWTEILDVFVDSGTVTGLIVDSVYYFAVAAYDSDSTAGKMSSIVTLLPKSPHSPFAVSGNGQRAYPELSWNYDEAESPLSFRVYRAEDANGDMELINETTDATFIDFTAVKGKQYYYQITSVSSEGFESPPSPKLKIIPMPMTSGILALDQNSYGLFDNLTFDRRYFRDLIDSALAEYSYTYRSFDPASPITLEQLSDYSLVILSSENRRGSLHPAFEETLRQYLANGGKVILILRVTGVGTEAEMQSTYLEISSTSVLSEYLYVDSSFSGAIDISSGLRLEGDLIGAIPENSTWPVLSWDSTKVNAFAYSVPDGIPYCGFILPRAGAEVMYRYQSSDAFGETNNAVNGISYLDDNYGFAMLNFPLSLMEIDSASVLIRTLVSELDERFICGDVNGDFRVNVGDVVSYISFLYHGGNPVRIVENGDVNCDTVHAMDDLLIILNYAMKFGLAPTCCE